MSVRGCLAFLIFTLTGAVCALSPTPYLDVCPGGVAEFTCTVEEEGTPGATLWRINETILACNVFHSNAPANGSCGPFQLILNPPVGNSYTSILRVHSVSVDLNNTDVDCRGPTNIVFVGNSTLRLSAPPTAPSFLRLSSSDFTGQDSSLQVTLRWTEPVVYPQPSDGAISRYVITSDQAGTCGGPDGCVVSRGGPQFSLREYTLGNLPLSQDYIFTVRADNCQMSGGFQTGMQSEGLPLSLQSPDIPVCSSVPVYSGNGTLVGIEANWTAVMAPVSEVAPGVDGDVTSYVLTIAEVVQSTEVLSPNEVCQLSNCSYRVSITFTGGSGMYTVILRARNIVGTGLQGECGAIGLMNTVVGVTPRTTDASSPVVQCVFSQLDAGSVASCRVCFGTDQSSLVNCSTGVGSAGEQEVTVTLPPLLTTARYFYRTEASIDGSIVVAVEGIFGTECDPADLGGSSDLTLSQQCSSTSAGSVSIPNGVVCYTSTSAGSTASYQCDGGHLVFSGNDTRTCQSDGNWNAAIQTCVFVGLLAWHVALTVLGVVSWVVATTLTVVGLVLILCARKPALLLWWHWLYIALLCANVVLLLVSAVLWIVFGAVVGNPTGHATELSDYLGLRDAMCGVTFALSLAALLVIAAVVCVHVIQREKMNTSTTAEGKEMVLKVFEGYEYPDQQEEDEFREPAVMKKRVEAGKSTAMTTVEKVPVPKAERKSKSEDKTAREATDPTGDGEYSALDHSKRRGEPSAAQQKPDEYQALKHPTGTGTRTQQPTPQQQQPPEVYHTLDHGTSGQLDKPAPPPPPSEQYGTLETGPHQTTTTTTTAGGAEYGKLNQNPKPDSKKDKGSKGKPKSQPPPSAEYSVLGTGRSTEGSAGQLPEYAEPHAGPRYTPHASNQ